MASTLGNNASVSLPAGSAGIANGNSVDMGIIISDPVAVITATAALTAGTIDVQGSLDNVNWYSLLQTVITAATDFTAAGVKAYPPLAQTGMLPCRYMRVIITAAITGGTITALCGGGI